MEKNIRLTLTGIQRDESGEEYVTTTHAPGQFYEKDGVLYLLYEETSRETHSVTKNKIKLKPKLMELTRRGEINTRMVFEPGKEYLTDYTTPFGSLKMELSTQNLDIQTERDRLQVRIDYILSSQGIPVSRCRLTILAE